MKPFTIAAGQVCARDDRAANLATATRLVREAADRGADVVCLPEMWAFVGRDADKIAGAETLDGPSMTAMKTLAQELGLPLINEVARQVMAELELSFESLRVNLHQVAKYQREVFARQLEVESRYPEGFVSDRTFCNLAYAARHSTALPDLLDARAMEYFKQVREEGLVFFVRPDRECMVNDGMRERVGWDEINRIDGILDFILSWQRIPAIGISELNMKDRVRTAMCAVRLYQRALGNRPANETRTRAHTRTSVSAPAVQNTAGSGNGNGNGNGHSKGGGNGNGNGNGASQAQESYAHLWSESATGY